MLWILRIIREEGAATVQRLIEATGSRQQSVSESVLRLRFLGLIERSRERASLGGRGGQVPWRYRLAAGYEARARDLGVDLADEEPEDGPRV